MPSAICILKFRFEVCELETHLKINKSRVQEPRASGRRGNSTGFVITGGKFSVGLEVSQDSLAGTGGQSSLYLYSEFWHFYGFGSGFSSAEQCFYLC